MREREREREREGERGRERDSVYQVTGERVACVAAMWTPNHSRQVYASLHVCYLLILSSNFLQGDEILSPGIRERERERGREREGRPHTLLTDYIGGLKTALLQSLLLCACLHACTRWDQRAVVASRCLQLHKARCVCVCAHAKNIHTWKSQLLIR